MKRLLTLGIVAAFLYPLAANAVIHSTTESYRNTGVSISLHDPIGSVYREGEKVGFSIRTDKSAYVVVFNIDTEGFVHLLYPAGGKNLQEFFADRVYDIPLDPGESFFVEGVKGLEFVFAVAVEDRDAINEDELHFLARNEMLPLDRRFRITGDPFLGANRVMSELIGGASLRREATISFTYFYVEEAVDFPRYLCEDCYEKGRDPYRDGMPTYVAVADFEKTDGLIYPLSEGFSDAASAAQADDTRSTVTHVYVSYYPRWDDGFYATSWWYLDPWYWNVWYWDPWYTPRSGFYFSVGWNWGWWGWGAYHYRYFPYYYYGPYYAYRPWPGYYGCYPDYWYGSSRHLRPAHHWRSYGVVQKGHGTRTLYGAMNQRVSRNFGLATRTTKPFDPAARRVSSAKPIGDDRTIRSLDKRRAVTGTDPRVIRGKPARASKDVRVVSPRVSRQTKEIRSGNGSYREQRVIRRVQGTKRTAAGNKQPSVTTGRAGSKPVRIEQKATDQRRTSRTGLAPNTTKQRPETRGTYKPNVRRSGGEKGATPRATRSSPRSSNSGSKASAPRRTSSSNSSKGSSRERR